MTFKTCRYCSHLIPVSANFCPYCARPTASSWWIWIRTHLKGVLLGAALIAILVRGLNTFSLWPFLPAPTITPTTAPTRSPAPTQTKIPTRTPTFPPTPTMTLTLTPTKILTPTPTPIEIVTQKASKDGMVQVFVPAGEFKMGSVRAEDPDATDEELPQHIVFLDAYWIDLTEVTNAQYAMCVADGGACTKPKDNSSLTRSSYYGNSQYANYPVLHVTWGQAAAYCTWAGRRLPTEAEWEKAARGPEGYFYPWGNTFDGTLANYCDINCKNEGLRDTTFDDGYSDTSRVGDYPDGASVYGALDMAGNAYEFVADWYGPYSRISQSNPTGPDSGQEHIIRGGSWGDDRDHIRAAIRSHKYVTDDHWTNYIGFRCAQ